MTGPLAENRQIELGERVGGDHLQALPGLHAGYGLAGCHHRFGAVHAAAVEDPVGPGRFIHG